MIVADFNCDGSIVFKSYKDSGLNVEILEKTDCQNNSSVLLLEPLKVYPGRKGMFNILLNLDNIERIKNLLSKSNGFGLSYLQIYNSGLGEKKIEKIVNSIEFYEQQVIRVLKLYGKNIKDENIFFKDKERKDFIVRSQLLDITKYLINGGKDYIFGEMNTSKKECLLERVQTGKENFTISDLANTISNYTTIEELEVGAVKTKVLDRFKI